MRALASNECKSNCEWHRAEADGQPAELEGQPLFECSGCHSEWVPSETWTPKNADGSISPDVEAARQGLGVIDDSTTGTGTTGSW